MLVMRFIVVYSYVPNANGLSLTACEIALQGQNESNSSLSKGNFRDILDVVAQLSNNTLNNY